MSQQPPPAQVYEDYLVTHFFRPFARDLVERAGPHPAERVLDVGCGTGVVARLVASRVIPHGTVTGLDPNAGMLAVARERAAAEALTIQWHEGDAIRLRATGSFDLVLSQQALQFVPDKLAAAREMHRVLAPGGRVVIATWSPIEASPVTAALDEVATAHLGTSVMAVPFGMGGPDALRTLLRDAGFSDPAVEMTRMTVRLPSYADYIAQQVREATAVVSTLRGLSAEEGERLAAAIEADLRPRIREYLDGEALNYPMQTDIGTARK